MAVTFSSELRQSVDRLGEILLHSPMRASFRIVSDDFQHFLRGCASPLSKPQEIFCQTTPDLRGRLDGRSPNGQLGYWSDHWAAAGVFSRFKEPEAGFGVVLSPPETDYVGRRLHFMANFFMKKPQCDEVLAVVEKNPAALFHFIAPTLTEGATPPLFQGMELSRSQQKYVSQFAKIYVHSMTNGTPPKSCCVPYDLKRGNPSGHLIRLG